MPPVFSPRIIVQSPREATRYADSSSEGGKHVVPQGGLIGLSGDFLYSIGYRASIFIWLSVTTPECSSPSRLVFTKRCRARPGLAV